MQFSESLKKNEQFRFVYKNGRSYANKYFIMYVKENGLDKNRIGISVSKKVGNSVVRHRITRLVRDQCQTSGTSSWSGRCCPGQAGGAAWCCTPCAPD